MYRLLVIEDDVCLNDLYESYFSGFKLFFALDREAIEKLVPKVDLVLCDYNFSEFLSFEDVIEIVDKRKPIVLCSGEKEMVDRYGGCAKVNLKDLRPLIEQTLEAIKRSIPRPACPHLGEPDLGGCPA